MINMSWKTTRTPLTVATLILTFLVIGVLKSKISPECAISQPEQALVKRVIDGDTIEVITHDGVQRVRYIGIDAPERGKPFSRMASEANSELVADKVITMYKDKVNQDRYGRLLRYVFIDDVFVNYELVGMGLAKTLTIPPNGSCRKLFMSAQMGAQVEERGLWAWKQYEEDVW
jgi:micrococcal nuclease